MEPKIFLVQSLKSYWGKQTLAGKEVTLRADRTGYYPGFPSAYALRARHFHVFIFLEPLYDVGIIPFLWLRKMWLGRLSDLSKVMVLAWFSDSVIFLPANCSLYQKTCVNNNNISPCGQTSWFSCFNKIVSTFSQTMVGKHCNRHLLVFDILTSIFLFFW